MAQSFSEHKVRDNGLITEHRIFVSPIALAGNFYELASSQLEHEEALFFWELLPRSKKTFPLPIRHAHPVSEEKSSRDLVIDYDSTPKSFDEVDMISVVAGPLHQFVVVATRAVCVPGGGVLIGSPFERRSCMVESLLSSQSPL